MRTSTVDDEYRYRRKKLGMELSSIDLGKRCDRSDLQVVMVQYVEEPIPDGNAYEH